MRRIQTDILVIGGGSTGTGVLRDLAMRGFKCVLLERRDLAYGTTGRFHGLLHSGARYVVKDPQAARECFEENKILRRIMPQCLEDTGGFYVLTPHDDPAYPPQFIEGCRNAGIPVDEIPIRQMLKLEPCLDPKIRLCYRVPDASADSFLAAYLNAESARQYHAQVLTYHELKSLTVIRQSSTGTVTVVGALCHDLFNDEDVQIDASLVVNASGAWSGIIAQTAGLKINMVPGKGTMLALNHRVVNTVISRCRPPSNGDILVPAHAVAVMGTTDIRVSDPNHYSIELWEIRLLLDEGEKLIPQFKQLRILRAWAGLRPLIKVDESNTDHEISRAFVLLDHAKRDGVDGIITITSGKWTTYRKMAQVTVDKICEKLGVDRPCRTHLEILPGQPAKRASYHYLESRLQKIETESTYGQLICECELSTVKDIEQALILSGAATLDDIRRETRLGMGPCQGAYCSFRASGMLHTLKHPPVLETNAALRDFIQERWKGNLSILAGQQLRQARFNELIYVDVLNAPHLPGDRVSVLASPDYAEPEAELLPVAQSEIHPATTPVPTGGGDVADTIVIGAGLAGLFTAWRAGMSGHKIHTITKGWGSLYWNSGCIDIFGYQPPDYLTRIDSPHEFLEKFTILNQEHPYTHAGMQSLENAVEAFLKLSQESDLPYHGSLEKNIIIPTSLGTLRPSCLVPETMIAGNTADRSAILIVGFDGFFDFYPAFTADNLTAQGIIATELSLDIPSLRNLKILTGMVLARQFDVPDFRQEVIAALKPKLGHVARIGFPAVLGLKDPMKVIQHLQSELGLPVFEIPGLPPSIPGIRLHNLLCSAIERNHGSVQNGMLVSKISTDNNSIKSIWSEAASRWKSHPAKTYVLATGGILGGGIITTNNGYAQETIFRLPINLPKQPSQWFQQHLLSGPGHPIHRSGVCVDSTFHPVDDNGELIYQNLYIVGGSLANCDPIRERSLEGIALTTGYKVGEAVSGIEAL